MQDANGNWLTCCIKGCDETVVSTGLCLNHLRRNQKYGSPVAAKITNWRSKRLSFDERFELYVTKGDGCWLWHGARDRDGYGAFSAQHDGSSYAKAHRYSYAVHKGPIPFGHSVCHSCDVPSCVNPAHLFTGTTAANMADKMAKGRHRSKFGEDHFNAVLTEEQAKAILSDPRPHTRIAAEYGVHAQTISSLKTRSSWQHLGKEKGVKAPRTSPNKGKSDKINPDIVRAIRASTDRGVDLAARFGIKQQDVSDIRKRRSWAHID